MTAIDVSSPSVGCCGRRDFPRYVIYIGASRGISGNARRSNSSQAVESQNDESLELADHQLDEVGYAQWLRDHTVPVWCAIGAGNARTT
jgi:hypothetical protein